MRRRLLEDDISTLGNLTTTFSSPVPCEVYATIDGVRTVMTGAGINITTATLNSPKDVLLELDSSSFGLTKIERKSDSRGGATLGGNLTPSKTQSANITITPTMKTWGLDLNLTVASTGGSTDPELPSFPGTAKFKVTGATSIGMTLYFDGSTYAVSGSTNVSLSGSGHMSLQINSSADSQYKFSSVSLSNSTSCSLTGLVISDDRRTADFDIIATANNWQGQITIVITTH